MELKRFPSGVLFDSLEIDADHGLLLVALPKAERLRVRDVKYLAAIADGLGLAAVHVALGNFTVYVSMTAYRAFATGAISQDEFVGLWEA